MILPYYCIVTYYFFLFTLIEFLIYFFIALRQHGGIGRRNALKMRRLLGVPVQIRVLLSQSERLLSCFTQYDRSAYVVAVFF